MKRKRKGNSEKVRKIEAKEHISKPSEYPAQPEASAKPTGAITLSWPKLVEAHAFCAAQRCCPREGVTREDVAHFAMSGDLVTQCYLHALLDAVPSAAETRQPFIPAYVERLLLAHVKRLNDMLCQMARAGRWHACIGLWEEAMKLTEAFSEMALKNPAPFKSKARWSLFMPSLRIPPTLRKSRKGRDTWEDGYLGDAPEIAKAVELSAETVGGKLTDNRVRLGALCARLVGECVHEIMRSRDHWAHFFIPYGKTVAWPTQEQIRPLVGLSQDEILDSHVPAGVSRDKRDEMQSHLCFYCLLAGCGSRRLHYLTLPELRVETAPEWWKGAIEGMVEAKFPTLLQQPVWARELKAVSIGTQADMLKELKDYSRDKVRQFA